MHFCMEYKAWHQEAKQAQRGMTDFSLVTSEVAAIVDNDEQGLADYINQATIDDIFPEGFTQKQLKVASDSCPESNNPVEMFRVATLALGLSVASD